MITPCPHCHAEIEIDPPTLAALQGQETFQCPSCEDLVAVPPISRPPVKVAAAAAIRPARAAAKPTASTLASTHRGLNRNLLILGGAALLVLGGLGFFLASQKSGDTNITNQNIRNEIINNSYFKQLIADGVTTKADLEAIADIRPYGENFIGVSRDSLTWEEAQKLADRTGSQILPMDDASSAPQSELLSWVQRTFEGLLTPSPWVSDRREAAILANSEVFPINNELRKGKVILCWQTGIRLDETELTARKVYKNLGQSALDEKIVFGGSNSIIFPLDPVFKEISPRLQVRWENRPFPVYESLWGEENVFCIHPTTVEIPGTVDFSEITAKASGNLIIKLRDDPRGDCRIEILKNDDIVKSINLDQDEWQTARVPFDRENVTIKIIATEWNCEYAFIAYEISQ